LYAAHASFALKNIETFGFVRELFTASPKKIKLKLIAVREAA
jgi:hypothetical protein